MSQKITCPNCNHEFELEESLEKHLRAEIEKTVNEDKKKLEAELKKTREDSEKQREKLESDLREEMNKKWVEQQKKMREKLENEAKSKFELELKDLEEQNKEKEKALKEAQEKELEFRKKQRELEQKEKTMELEIQKKLDAEKDKLGDQIKKEIDEENRMKIKEKDKQMDMLKKTIEDLKRKSEQGSMQIQGEVQEEDLKQILSEKFMYDDIEDVPTGVNGADLVQTVKTNFGNKAGILLWESKNTKTFSDKWISKLKDDQVKVKADICILITQAMPEGIDNFGMIDGVWVTNYPSALPLTHALRTQLLQLAKVKSSMEGRDEKMNMLYKYLSGSQFKSRVENIVMAFSQMKSDLETEKRSMQRIWSKREKEIERVVMNTTGMYGDLQGIIGASLATVESLELEFDENENKEELKLID